MKDLYVGLLFYTILLYSLYNIGSGVIGYRIYKENISLNTLQVFLRDLRHILKMYRWVAFSGYVHTSKPRKTSRIGHAVDILGIMGFTLILVFCLVIFISSIIYSQNPQSVAINIFWLSLSLITIGYSRVWNFGSQLSQIEASLNKYNHEK